MGRLCARALGGGPRVGCPICPSCGCCCCEPCMSASPVLRRKAPDEFSRDCIDNLSRGTRHRRQTHRPRAHRLTYVFICSAQSVLAYTTGVVAGSAGTFLIVRTVWQRAQLQGDVADARIAELQRLRGHSEDAPPQVSSLSLSYFMFALFRACSISHSLL